MSVYYNEWRISKTNQFSGISVESEHFMWQLYIMQQHGDIARLEKSVSFIAHQAEALISHLNHFEVEVLCPKSYNHFLS